MNVESHVLLIYFNLSIGFEQLKRFQKETQEDAESTDLQNYMLNGWPKVKLHINDIIMPYYKFKKEVSLVNGDRILVPKSLRQEMLSKIHCNPVSIIK